MRPLRSRCHCDLRRGPELTTRKQGFCEPRASKGEKTLEMMADHGSPCNGQEATYCMNGGTCYKIASVDTLSCVCNENYKGGRCEQFQLPIFSRNPEEAGLIAAVVVTALLILVVLVVIIYYIRKMMKAKKQRQENQQNHTPEYWKVQSRA